jgi:uncharacterized protein (DUF488 family)
MKTTRVFTIGFTKKSAEQFFTAMKEAGVQRVLDIRLNNVSQLAGFAKRDDLRYFLKAICGIGYEHRLELAPTKELLEAYRKGGEKWSDYEKDFLGLISDRKIETLISRDVLDHACLLCGENTPDHCHRRLVAEYLRDRWGDLEITHI